MRVSAQRSADFVERVTEDLGFKNLSRPRVHATDELRNENIAVDSLRVAGR
jgi:hypothetical protein